MSAIKELTKDFGCASERQIMDAFQEISNRLDALEAKAHYHSATNDHETCMHKHTCEIYNGVCEYKPDTERSCGNCNLLVGCKVVLSSGQDCCDFWEQYVPRQKQPAQEQLWICPKAKDCPCNQHILKKPSCNHVVPHKKSRMCESASSVCPECIPYAQEQGGDDKDYDALLKKYQDLMAWYDNHSGTPCEQIRHEHEVADLRARLEQAEKDNAELKRIFPAICTALVNGACCSESSSVEFLREIPNEVAAVVKKLSEENAELKRQLNSEVK